MNLMIKAFGAENLYGAKPEEGTDRNAGKKHIFGGNLHLADDPVEQRRKEAREQAWDIVKNAWDNDNSVDKMIDDRKGHYADMMEQMGEATKKLSEVHKERKALEEQYGKDSTAKEYTDRLWELNAKEETWQTKVWKIQKEMRADMAGVRGIQQERLKSAPMQEAQEASEQIMENEAGGNEGRSQRGNGGEGRTRGGAGGKTAGACNAGSACGRDRRGCEKGEGAEAEAQCTKDGYCGDNGAYTERQRGRRGRSESR